MTTIADQLLADIEAFLDRYEMKPTTFGWLSCRDKATVRRLREGLGITSKRIDQIREFMRTYEGNGPANRGKRGRVPEAIAA